jgi:hypothetical protein
MPGRLMALALVLALLGWGCSGAHRIESTPPSRVADLGAVADATPVAAPAECPHSAPAADSPCVPTAAAACTYTDTTPGAACRTVIATCRNGRWRRECLPVDR